MREMNNGTNQNTTGQGPETNPTYFSERDIMFDLLTSCKNLASLYHNFSIECSNDMLLDVVEDLREEIIDEQRDCFNYMYSKGWYPVEKESKTKVNKEVQHHSQFKDQLKRNFGYGQ